MGSDPGIRFRDPRTWRTAISVQIEHSKFSCSFHRHHLQPDDATKDAVLHGQPDYPLCGDQLSDHPGVLPAIRLGREGHPLHLDPAVAHRVLPAAGRDHPADVSGGAAARQVPAVHHGAGDAVNLRHRRRAQRPLQVSPEQHTYSYCSMYTYSTREKYSAPSTRRRMRAKVKNMDLKFC